jgi:hypothetical protein
VTGGDVAAAVLQNKATAATVASLRLPHIILSLPCEEQKRQTLPGEVTCGNDLAMRLSKLQRPYRKPFKKGGKISYKRQPIDRVAARVTGWRKRRKKKGSLSPPSRKNKLPTGFVRCRYCKIQVKAERRDQHGRRVHPGWWEKEIKDLNRRNRSTSKKPASIEHVAR